MLSRVFSLILRPRSGKRNVLYLAAFYPGNAGYHWRVEKWAEVLRAEGYHVEIKVASKEKYLDEYDSHPFRFLLFFMIKRFFQVINARKYETVVVRRELLLFNDYGHHFLERLLTQICGNLILDIDDDLAASKRQPFEVNNLFARILMEDGNSFRNSFRYYDGFFVASNYLKSYVRRYVDIEDSRISVIPTCVDYDRYPVKKYNLLTDTIHLGWIGGEHNYMHLAGILPELELLSLENKLELIIIGGGEFTYPTSLNIKQLKWSLEDEVDMLYQIDIGLMPLKISEQSKGKGGFKLIQYMGLGIVGVASAITINEEIIEDGVSGFLVFDNDWYTVLRRIIENRNQFTQIGEQGRLKIMSEYTYAANLDKYEKMVRLNK